MKIDGFLSVLRHISVPIRDIMEVSFAIRHLSLAIRNLLCVVFFC